ncbi:MAG: hypothetical protein ABI760_04815 [Ferruginibacter sp.]
MKISTEPTGSIPGQPELIEGMKAQAAGRLSKQDPDQLFESVITDTIKRFGATGSPVITDGEQTNPGFAIYPISDMKQSDPNGLVIHFTPFDDDTYASDITFAKIKARIEDTLLAEAIMNNTNGSSK